MPVFQGSDGEHPCHCGLNCKPDLSAVMTAFSENGKRSAREALILFHARVGPWSPVSECKYIVHTYEILCS